MQLFDFVCCYLSNSRLQTSNPTCALCSFDSPKPEELVVALQQFSVVDYANDNQERNNCFSLAFSVVNIMSLYDVTSLYTYCVIQNIASPSTNLWTYGIPTKKYKPNLTLKEISSLQTRHLIKVEVQWVALLPDEVMNSVLETDNSNRVNAFSSI